MSAEPSSSATCGRSHATCRFPDEPDLVRGVRSELRATPAETAAARAPAARDRARSHWRWGSPPRSRCRRRARRSSTSSGSAAPRSSASRRSPSSSRTRRARRAGPVSLEDAREAAGFRILTPPDCDHCDTVLFDETVPGGRVTIVWPGRSPRLFLMQFRGEATPYVEKLATPRTPVRQVSVDDVAGYWVAGLPARGDLQGRARADALRPPPRRQRAALGAGRRHLPARGRRAAPPRARDRREPRVADGTGPAGRCSRSDRVDERRNDAHDRPGARGSRRARAARRPPRAGGFATVGLSALPGDDLRGGDRWTPELTVLQHGRTPLDGVQPRLTIRNPATGATETFDARPTGEPGRYVVDVRFPVGRQPGRTRSTTASRGVHTFAPVTVGEPLAGGRTWTPLARRRSARPRTRGGRLRAAPPPADARSVRQRRLSDAHAGPGRERARPGPPAERLILRKSWGSPGEGTSIVTVRPNTSTMTTAETQDRTEIERVEGWRREELLRAGYATAAAAELAGAHRHRPPPRDRARQARLSARARRLDPRLGLRASAAPAPRAAGCRATDRRGRHNPARDPPRASIPSPSSGELELGPITLHAYGLMLLLAIAAAVGRHRDPLDAARRRLGPRLPRRRLGRRGRHRRRAALPRGHELGPGAGPEVARRLRGLGGRPRRVGRHLLRRPRRAPSWCAAPGTASSSSWTRSRPACSWRRRSAAGATGGTRSSSASRPSGLGARDRPRAAPRRVHLRPDLPPDLPLRVDLLPGRRRPAAPRGAALPHPPARPLRALRRVLLRGRFFQELLRVDPSHELSACA